jgi:hypothetical protein
MADRTEEAANYVEEVFIEANVDEDRLPLFDFETNPVEGE